MTNGESQGAAATADPVERMNEELAASLGRQLADLGVDTSSIEAGLVKIVSSLGDQASQFVLRSMATPGGVGRSGAPIHALGLPVGSIHEGEGFHDQVRATRAFDQVQQACAAAAPSDFPSPNESFSLGDTPNGDFPAGGQAQPGSSPDAGVFDRLASEQRTARVDTFKTVVAGGLHMLSGWLESQAARILASAPPAFQTDRLPIGFSPSLGGSGSAPNHLTPPFMSLRAGVAQRPLSEWVELDPGAFGPPVDETGFVVSEATASRPAQGMDFVANKTPSKSGGAQ